MRAVLRWQARKSLAILVPLLALAFPLPALPECRAFAHLQQRLQLSSQQEPALGSYSNGLVYLDAGCLDDAEREFRKAEQVLSGETNAGVQRKELLGLAKAALDLTRAQRLVLTGQRQSAITALSAIFNRYPASVVVLRALLTLTSLLPADAPQWREAEQDLETLANIGHWQARKALVERQTASGKAASAVASLELLLNKSENLQERHAIRILLAEAYRASGRVLEAWLLVREEERSGAEEILDWQLRIELLRVATEIARARAAAAEGDPEATAALAIYGTAYQEVIRQ